MKITKSIALVLMGLTLAISSCKKDKKESTSTKGWEIGSNKYTSKITIGIDMEEDGYGLASYDKTEMTGDNAVMVIFKSRPTASGTYTLVLEDNGENLTAGQAIVLGLQKINGVQYASIAKSGTVKVSIVNNKLSVSVPQTEAATGIVDGNFVKNTTIKVDITEN